MIELSISITYVKTFSERLRFTRELRGLTQAQLARACKLSQSAIANYEAGTRNLPRDIFRLAEILQVNAQWLYEGSGPISHEAQATSQANYPLQEAGAGQALAIWPFRDVSPQAYWALPQKDQDLIESTVVTLMANLRKQQDNGPA